MKVLANNDTMEFLKIGLSESQSGGPKFMTHNMQICDQRADWTMRLLQSWGVGAVMGDIMAKYGFDEHKIQVTPVPPQELVMRTCEVVDAAWNEMLHRGWILKTDSVGE